ncbi:tyrosine recombinase XerC [Streptomyces sp. NPDC021224]|uniref:site-specific integrase n=1 Tax=unclassified Streptomyces TaxID=2593676 RepID=UPI00378A37A6
MTALQLRQKEQEAAKQAAGELWTESDFVFTTRYGTPVEPRNFNRSFANRSDKAGVRRIRLHDTRHTCGSLLAALDVHPRAAMQILRHSKITVTMEVYTHIPSEATRKALRKLGKHLGPAGSKLAAVLCCCTPRKSPSRIIPGRGFELRWT